MADGYSATKRCATCGEDKPRDNSHFHRNKQQRDGFSCYCKPCSNARAMKWHTDNRERHLEKMRQYLIENNEEINAKRRQAWEDNPDFFRERLQRYRDQNPDRYKEYARQGYLKHREKRLAACKIYRSVNIEAHKKRKLNWQRANKDIVAAARHRRRAWKMAAPGSFTAADISNLFAKQKGRCACCKTKLTKYHIDHIVSLSKGGSNYPTNLQLLCPSCNTKKRDTDPIEFMQKMGMLL